MTMIERVAREFYETNPIAEDWDSLAKDERAYWMACARAASAVVVEECAQIVDNWRRGYGLKYLAEAIRALKEKP